MYKNIVIFILSITCFQNAFANKIAIGVGAHDEAEFFQEDLVARALQELGYYVPPIMRAGYAMIYQALKYNQVQWMAYYWEPGHNNFIDKKKLIVFDNIFISDCDQGYVIDKKTADKYNIKYLSQLQDPKLAKIFDKDYDNKADLIACNPGWFCDDVINNHIKYLKLNNNINQNKGSYDAIMLNGLQYLRNNEPFFAYVFTPHWSAEQYKLNKLTIKLELEPNNNQNHNKKFNKYNYGKYGFKKAIMRIVANKKWAKQNADASKLFSLMQIPIADINYAVAKIKQGNNSPSDIRELTNNWIAKNKKLFYSWIKEAKKSSKNELVN